MTTEKSGNTNDNAGQDFDPYGDASPMPEVAYQELENSKDHGGVRLAAIEETKDVAGSPENNLSGLEPQNHLQNVTEDATLQSQIPGGKDNLPGLDLHHTSDAFLDPKVTPNSSAEQANGMVDQAEDEHESSPAVQAQDTIQQEDHSAEEIGSSESQSKPDSTEPTVDIEILDAEMVLQDVSLQGEQLNGNGAPEVEYDSSAAESSSDEISSSDSDGSDDSEEDYELLDPAEQARRLMEGDGSEDEGGKVNAGGSLKTANEKEDEAIEIPDIKMTPETKIEELGKIEAVVGNMILIKAKTSGEYQVLESGSVLCTSERVVIGVVTETLGRVQEPLYCVRFSNTHTISTFGLERTTPIYYIPEHSYFVFTQALQGIKGSDASNINDEEVGGDEIEFSDDEAEAQYKRQKKLQKQDRKGPRGGSNRGRGDSSRGTPRAQENESAISLPYDDVNMDDQLYTPLVRPSSLNNPGQLTSHEQASNGYSRGPGGTRGFGGRGRGGNRGRADRNNHFAGRQQTTPSSSQSMPAHTFTQPRDQYTQPQTLQPQIPYQTQAYQPPHPYNQYNQVQFSGQQHPYAPQYNQSNQWQSAFPQAQQQTQQVPFQANPSQSGMPNLPPGAFYNPAFFTNQPGNPPG